MKENNHNFDDFLNTDLYNKTDFFDSKKFSLICILLFIAILAGFSYTTYSLYYEQDNLDYIEYQHAINTFIQKENYDLQFHTRFDSEKQVLYLTNVSLENENRLNHYYQQYENLYHYHSFCKINSCNIEISKKTG